jgi:hypothetical protein
MKPFIPLKMTGVLMFSLLAIALQSQVKIGNNPAILNPSAVLELEKTNQGLLITRIALTGATDVTTIPSPANSLLIYNTATAGSGGNAVTPGFYYFDSGAGRWKGLLTSSGPAGDVWIDGHENILSVNSANQSITGTHNVILGEQAFEDWDDTTNSYIAIGYQAGKEDITDKDADVVAIGYQAAFGNSAKNLNAIGMTAGYSNTGQSVNAFGRQAAFNNQGEDVNALGWEAARQNMGSYLNALGFQAGYSNGGYDVNLMGWEAGLNNLGNSVNAMGFLAGMNNTGSLVNVFGGSAGENNTAWSVNCLGNQSGQFNQGAELNAMGAMSAQFNTSAALNAFGREAARYNTGYGVNAFGDEAAKWNSGDHNIAIGNDALFGDTLVNEGFGNIGIGFEAGISVNTGERNICLGYQADIPNPLASDQINIGNNIVRESFGMIRMKDYLQLTPLSDPPDTVEEGTIYYNSTEHKLFVRTNTGWQACW